MIMTISVGGPKWTHADRKIASKYGVNEGVGDTLGPGGVFYAARHVPPILDICHDMEKICPNAWLMNYTNPMAIISWAINDYTTVKNVGLCHSVQGTSAELARYIGIPREELSYWVAGINHMAWFLKLQMKGKDMYPLLREKFKDPRFIQSPIRTGRGRMSYAQKSSRHSAISIPNPASTCRSILPISGRGRNCLKSSC